MILPYSPHLLPLGTAGRYSRFIPHSPLPDRVLLLSLQEKRLQPGATAYCSSAVKESIKPPAPSLHDPNHHPPSWLPTHRWLMRWSLPAAQHHHSAASHISRTTVKQIYLSCNYGAKTSKEQSWGPTVTPRILAVSPLSSSLYIFVPTFHLGLPLFGISGQITTPLKSSKCLRGPALALDEFRHLHTLSSPTPSSTTLSQARLRNLLLLCFFSKP